MDRGHQDTVYEGEGSAANRAVPALLLGVGVEGHVGVLTVPGTPSRIWNNFISSPPDSEPLRHGREMENAPEDIRDILAASPPLSSVPLSMQRHLGSIVREGVPRYPDVISLEPPWSPQEKVALDKGTRRVISAKKKDKACR